jgi:hypothetical protein
MYQIKIIWCVNPLSCFGDVWFETLNYIHFKVLGLILLIWFAILKLRYGEKYVAKDYPISHTTFNMLENFDKSENWADVWHMTH